MTRPPTVTVCVPTYRRPESLERALDALFALEPPPGGYEVVVIDDGSPVSDGVQAVLARAEAAAPVPFRWKSFDGNRGAAVARNEAWRMGRGEWVAFTDDDCRPARDWLVQLLAEGADADVVQGRTVPDRARAELLGRPFVRSLRVEQFDHLYETCNIAYRRSLLEDLGGFDERFRLACDDTDLGWRAAAAGARTCFAAGAVVEHEVVVRDWRGDLRSRRRWADAVHMAARHPAARTLAWRPYVYRKEHVPVLAAAASLVLLSGRRTRRLWAAGAVAASIGTVVRAGSAAAALTALQRRTVDAYEVGVVVRASARHRTVLL